MVKTSSKSSHHKDTNRFKFQSFSDQIAHINIDVIHQSKRTESSPKYADSFFAEGLAKWKELNCTQDFVNFSHEILGQVQSFAQLVHFEDKIVGALKNHLRVSNSMAYLPLMDLVVQLARDLQMDFYPHFPEFFDIIVSLLDTQDAELIEGAFQCLCYLFKFLWRYLVRDIHDVYRIYSPLLSEDQRPHIRQFAAESFAFLMRKVKGHGQLFDAMLGSLEENPEKAKGLGRLFFDMLKGVRHQVHSSTSKILPVLLSRLGPCPRHDESEECKGAPASLPWELVLDSFQETIQCLCGYLRREHSSIIWHTFLEEVAFLERKLENMSSGQIKDGVIGQLSRLVILLQQMVQWGSGHLVLEPRKLCEATVRLVGKHYLPKADGAVALSFLVGLLKTTKAHLSQEDTSILIQVLFDNEYSSRHILHATRSLFLLPGFEQDILPSLCEYCHAKMASQDEVETVLFTMTKLIVLKSPQVEVGSDLVDYIPYCIDFSRHIQISLVKQKKLQRKSPSPPNFPDHLMSCLETALSSNLTSDDHFHDLWAALVCIPHVKPLDHSKCQSRIQDIILRLVQTLDEETAEKKDEKAYVLSAAIQSLLLISKSHHPTDVLKMSLVRSLLRTCPNSCHILLATSCYFSLCEVFGPGSKAEGIVTADTLKDLYPLFEQNLLASSSRIRRLTLQILNNLPVTLPSSQDHPLPQVSIFRLCLQAEETPVAVETYRDRLKCLRKLEHTLAKHNIPVGNFESVPLRYLISQLYVNFQLLWDPVGDIIKTHAYGMDKKLFWDVYSQALHSAASHTEQNLFYIRSTQMHQTQHIDASINFDITEVSSLPGLFSRCQGDASSSMDRPDHGNFRRLLWKTMENFPNRAEGRSRELSPLLLRFMKKEFYVRDVSNAPTQNLYQVKGQPKDQVTESEEEGGDVKGKKKRPMNKALVAHLNLFSKFKDPKSLYLEPELRQLYLNLLANRNPDVQKAALACLYTYNYKYLSPYRENLDQLMDDKLFRDALVHFGIDTTSGIVNPVDREGLLPVLLRILYGKMLSKTGPGTQGKSGIATRRSVILRFIAGSSAAEMKVFIDLVLEPCQHLIQDNLSEMLRVWTTQDPAAIVPLRKQLSTLDTIGVIFSKLGHLIDPYLSLFLGIITCAVASYNTLLLQRNELVPFCITQLKNLRQTGICRLIEFFERFEEYPFTAREVETIFEAVVFPQVGKLSSDSSTGPTPVLRLARCWSQNVRYRPLLIKPHPDDRNLTLLHQAMTLLTMPKVGSTVVAMVMEIVENLLTQEEEEEGEMDEEKDGCDFIPGVSLDCVEEGPDGAKLGIGTRMLLPYVPVILSHLKSAIQIKQVPAVKAAPVLLVKELGILYKISVFAQASELCSSLIGLLLPYLQKSSSVPQGTDVEILTTVRNLMKLVDDPSQFLSVLSRLLYRLTSEPARMVLVQVFSAMATRDPSLDEITRTVARLNARDKKHLGEPDYELRLKAFKRANQKLAEEDSLDLRSFSPIIHNCFYFILKIEDMSMRDNASHLLTEVISKLCRSGRETAAFVTVIEHTFIPALRDGVRAKTEAARHETVAILSQLVKAFPEHPHFATMSVLLDKDVEVDFFENIRHIQHHRRMRALRRLSKHCQEGALSAKAIQHFLLPSATSMIFDPEVAKNMNLVVEAIAAVGAMARVLPWQQYLRLLTQYLRLLMKSLEYQKIAVRLIVAVLDAFHFDLSLSKGFDEKSSYRVGSGIESESKELQGKTYDTVVAGEEEEEKDDIDDDGKDGDEDGVHEGEETGADSGIEDEKDKEDEKGIAMATRIHRTIARSILPQLHKIITKKTRSEGEHKKARNRMAEDEEVLRVPIALAVIKLLQALPKETMNQNLFSVLLKVCQMLRSRAMDVRSVTRETLVKILDSLGVGYFGLILKQLRSSLTRGYQLHVLGFTVHMLLKNMAPRLRPGDLDSCLESLLQIFNQELFGAVSEEKEVEGIVGKLPEARSIKAYDCYEMVSKVVGQGSITKMITPLKEVLDTSHSHRTSNRVRETLRRCAIGLQENAGITQEALLIFIHGLTSETLPLMNKTSKSEVSEAIAPKEGQRPPSTYLLPPTPTRAGIVPETSAKTHHHILVEFGLQLLNMSLKRSKLVASNEQHLSMLDPFTLILIKSMESQHTRVISMALRCLCWLLRYALPTLDELIKQLTQILFRLLRKYARAGAAKGDNFELMVVTFKAMTVLIRDVKQHTINEKQLQVLLAYAEEDIHDHTRQATAFGLLKAILSRRLVSPEMNGIMEKVSQLSITSPSPSARIQCREVMHQFLLDYPLGKKLKRHLEFYVKQLSFSIETGRESALEMLATIYSTFPQKLLMEHAGLFFIPMATRLVNDDSAKCRKLTALALVTLLNKLTLEKRDDLFAVTLQWLKDTKRSHQRLAAQLSGLFVDCEKDTFSRHLAQILPVIDETIKPGNFKEEEEEEDSEVKAQDHLLYHLMAMLSKITKHFHLTSYKDQQTVVNSIWESVEAHLVHPHAWVRLMACRLFGKMFATLQPDDVVTTATIAKSPPAAVTPVTSAPAGTKKKKQKREKKLTSKQEEPEVQTQGMDVSKTRDSATRVQEKFEYLQGDVEKRMLGLANKFCVQLNSSMVTKELAEQVVKNLIFVSKVVHRLHPVPQPSPFKRKKGPDSKEEAQEGDGGDAEDVVCSETEEQDTKLEENRDAESLTIQWLVRKMSHIAATEVAKTAKVTLRRSSVIKWMAATALEVGQGLVEPLLPSMLQVVAREVNDKASHGDAELRVLCQEVMELLKGLVGLETFSNIFAAVQRNASENRLARKRKRALEAVANPDKAAERRMRIQQLKKEARKRKLQALRPTYHINKRPRLKGR